VIVIPAGRADMNIGFAHKRHFNSIGYNSIDGIWAATIWEMAYRNRNFYSAARPVNGRRGQNRFIQAAGGFGVRLEKLASLFPHRNFNTNFDYPDAYHLAH